MFKDRLKEARKAAKLTQEKLAEQIGVKKSTVAGYESGNSEPDMAKLIKIMQVLNIDANYLCQDEMQLNSESESALSDRAMEIARSYDSMSSYGKSLIDKIIENEKKYKVMKAVPMMAPGGFAEVNNTGEVELKEAANQERRELHKEIKEIQSKLTR